MEPGRRRLYGLIVNTRPGAAAPARPVAAAASVTLGVMRVGEQGYSLELNLNLDLDGVACE